MIFLGQEGENVTVQRKTMTSPSTLEPYPVALYGTLSNAIRGQGFQEAFNHRPCSRIFEFEYCCGRRTKRVHHHTHYVSYHNHLVQLIFFNGEHLVVS